MTVTIQELGNLNQWQQRNNGRCRHRSFYFIHWMWRHVSLWVQCTQTMYSNLSSSPELMSLLSLVVSCQYRWVLSEPLQWRNGSLVLEKVKKLVQRAHDSFIQITNHQYLSSYWTCSFSVCYPMLLAPRVIIMIYPSYLLVGSHITCSTAVMTSDMVDPWHSNLTTPKITIKSTGPMKNNHIKSHKKKNMFNEVTIVRLTRG